MQSLLLSALLLLLQGLNAPTGVVSGRIRSSNGLPAVGVRVSAMLAPEAGRPGGADAADAGALFSQTQTDDGGRYRLEGIPPGRYYIMAGRVDAPTFYPGKEDIVGATAISVATSAPIEGIDFAITDTSAQKIPPAGFGGGTFVIATPEVTVPVRFHGENGIRIPLTSAQGPTLVSAKPTANSLPPSGAVVSVTMTSGGTFSLRTPASALATVGTTVTGTVRSTPAVLLPDGSSKGLKVSPGEFRFSVDNLPPDYEVKSFTADSVDLLKNPFRVTPSAIPNIEVTLGLKSPAPRRSGRTISGQVLDGFTSKPWVAEAVYLAGSPGTLFSDGTFQFQGVAPGRYTLEAREGLPADRKARRDIVVGATDVAADLTYTEPPKYVRVVGRVVMDAGNAPRLNNVRITVSNTGTPLLVAGDGSFSTAMTEGAYSFSVSDLPVGYVVKSITSGSTDVLNQPLQIQPTLGPVAPDVIVTLGATPRYKVQGRVTADPPTRPVEGAEIVLTGGPENYRTKAAANGTWELPQVLPGSYALAIRPFGFTYVNATVVVVDQDLKLEFTAEPAY